MTIWHMTRRYVGKHAPWYIVGTAFMALTNWLAMEIPQLAKVIINRFGAQSGEDLVQADMVDLALIIVALGVLQMLVRVVSRVCIFWPARSIEAEFKDDLLNRLMRLPMSFFLKQKTGDLISRMSNDIDSLRSFYGFGMLQLLNLVFVSIFALGMMLQTNATLALLCLIPLSLTIVITRQLMPVLQRLNKKNQAAIGDLTQRVTETYAQVHVVKTAGADAAFLARNQEKNESVYASQMSLIWLRTFFFPLMAWLAKFSQLIILFYGGQQVMAGDLTVGDLFAFNVYVGLLGFPLTAIGIILGILQRARAALERLSVIEEAELEDAPAKNPLPAQHATVRAAEKATTQETMRVQDSGDQGASSERSRGSLVRGAQPLIEMRNVSFRYFEAPQLALSEVNMQVFAGEKIGIFGRIGSGKSTLFQLMVRTLEPEVGCLFFAGKDVTSYQVQDLRNQILFLPQLHHMFSDSISSNIGLGLEQVDQDQIRAALKKAQLDGDLQQFPQGLATEIGERGVRLSGGQKQRLALSRAFLRTDRRVWLLDDVSSALDHETEARLKHELAALDVTLFLTSHRPAGLSFCDRIYLFEEGRCVDRGSPAELEKRHPKLDFTGTDSTQTSSSGASTAT